MAKAPGMIRKRGTGWQVVIRVNGERHQYGPRNEPLLADASRNDVEEWTWRQYCELEKAAKREADGLPGRVKFSALLEQFEEEELPTLAKGTREAYTDSFRPIRTYFVDKLDDPVIGRIHARHIKAFLTWRRVNRRDGKTPLSNRTLAKDRAVLHRIFAFADAMEMRDGNPVARVDAPKCDPHDPVILDDDQYDRLIEECYRTGPMLGLWALLMGESGARAYSEALQLRWEDVDLEKGFIRIPSKPGRRTKGGKGRWTPMTPRLAKAMRDHFAAFRFATYGGERTPFIFHHERTRRHAKAGERINDPRRAFDAAAKRAKLPEGFRRHDLRHRRVTTWLAEGRDVVLVKEAVGHSDLRTTMGYTHLAREHLRALVDEPESPEKVKASG
jgi:integrase